MSSHKVAGGLIVALAFTIIASAPASAVVFTLSRTRCEGGTNTALCWELEKTVYDELEGEQSFTTESGAAVFTIKSEPAQPIECTKSKGGGTVIQSGGGTTFKTILTYEGCKLGGVLGKKCAIPATEATNPLLGTFQSGSTIKLTPELGLEFLDLIYSNIEGPEVCPTLIKGLHAITGSQTFEISSPAVYAKTKSMKAIGETLGWSTSAVTLSQEITLGFPGLEDDVGVSTTA